MIDIDQGHSGASAADREGFQHLVAEVSMGKAGIVLGLECSRLARNNADWHQLLRICAHNDCLILDEDGLYDPTSFNDRLLLGMKGQLSEAELHFLRSRLRGGILAKARRGELRLQLPIGLVYDPLGQVTLDPDAGVRSALSLLFETFTATSSAFAVVKTFRDQQLSFPGRHRSGPRAGELYWNSLTHDQVLRILHNPAYAGAYAYGRARHTTGLDGRHHTLSKPVDGVPAISWTFPLCCFWCPIVKLALVIRWAYLAEPTLFPNVIVISLDVVEHGGPDLARVAPHVLIDQLLLDRRIKRFRRRIVIAYAGVPDRRDNTLGEKAVAVPSRGILGTAVMVRHKLAYAYSRPAGSQRIIQGLEHQARAHVVGCVSLRGVTFPVFSVMR